MTYPGMRPAPSLHEVHLGEAESLWAQREYLLAAPDRTLEHVAAREARLPQGALTRDTPLFLALPAPLALGMAVAPELERDEDRRLNSQGKRVLSITFGNLGWPWPGGPWQWKVVPEALQGNQLSAPQVAFERNKGKSLYPFGVLN